MSDITPRKIDFEFPDDTPLYALPSMPRISLFIAAFSLTMPYLEPYLIRMYLKVQRENLVDDEALLEDIKAFSQQEGNHYRNHARINEIIRSKFDDQTAAELLAIEQELKQDYEDFLENRSMKFNLAYAEGFEAMTCAVAINSANRVDDSEAPKQGWAGLLDWHALEEVEHRTVAFNVYNHVYGDYAYRVIGGIKAQAHYLYAIHKFYRVMLKARGMRMLPYIPWFILGGHVRYLNTLMPWYNPANYEIKGNLKARLDKFSEMAAG